MAFPRWSTICLTDGVKFVIQYLIYFKHKSANKNPAAFSASLSV